MWALQRVLPCLVVFKTYRVVYSPFQVKVGKHFFSCNSWFTMYLNILCTMRLKHWSVSISLCKITSKFCSTTVMSRNTQIENMLNCNKIHYAIFLIILLSVKNETGFQPVWLILQYLIILEFLYELSYSYHAKTRNMLLFNIDFVF